MKPAARLRLRLLKKAIRASEDLATLLLSVEVNVGAVPNGANDIAHLKSRLLALYGLNVIPKGSKP